MHFKSSGGFAETYRIERTVQGANQRTGAGFNSSFVESNKEVKVIKCIYSMHDRDRQFVSDRDFPVHPNFLRYCGTQVVEPGISDPYLVDWGVRQVIFMENVPNGELWDLYSAVHSNGLPPSELFMRRLINELIAPFLELYGAHRLEKIYHRDVKLENFLLDSEGRLRLIDFGLARKLNPMQHLITPGNSGTEAYWSPQRRAQLPLNPELDEVYSIGRIIYGLYPMNTLMSEFEVHRPTFAQLFAALEAADDSDPVFACRPFFEKLQWLREPQATDKEYSDELRQLLRADAAVHMTSIRLYFSARPDIIDPQSDFISFRDAVSGIVMPGVPGADGPFTLATQDATVTASKTFQARDFTTGRVAGKGRISLSSHRNERGSRVHCIVVERESGTNAHEIFKYHLRGAMRRHGWQLATVSEAPKADFLDTDSSAVVQGGLRVGRDILGTLATQGVDLSGGKWCQVRLKVIKCGKCENNSKVLI